jgi:hypothetical protein
MECVVSCMASTIVSRNASSMATKIACSMARSMASSMANKIASKIASRIASRIASCMATKIARMIQGCHGHGDKDPIRKGHLKEAAHLAVSLQQVKLVEKVRWSNVRVVTRLASVASADALTRLQHTLSKC